MNFTVRNCVVDKNQSGCRDELKKQLRTGDVGSTGEQNKLLETLLARNKTFALNDLELGETDVVRHSINSNGAPPVKTSPQWIPYTLCKDHEKELYIIYLRLDVLKLQRVRTPRNWCWYRRKEEDCVSV